MNRVEQGVRERDRCGSWQRYTVSGKSTMTGSGPKGLVILEEWKVKISERLGFGTSVVNGKKKYFGYCTEK